MRRLLLIFAIFSCLFLLISCTNDEVNEDMNHQEEMENQEEQALNIARNFIEKMYTISYDNVQLQKPEDIIAYKELLSVYLTDDAFADLSPKDMTAQVNWAEAEQVNLTVIDLNVREMKVKEEGYDILFTFTVQIEDEQNNMKEENINGEMTIVKENEMTLKIGRYYDQFFTLYQSK